jgi:hypothetical protein
MDNLDLLWLIPAAALMLVAAILLRRRDKPGQQAADDAPSTLAPVAIPLRPAFEELPDTRPTAIVIGTRSDVPMLTIKLVSSLSEFGEVKPIDARREGATGRLGPLLQAASSLLVAQEASGKQLMEVVINGSLVTAADGNGLRAFAIGPKGIEEHARLFNVANLQDMVTAAALWQVASVLVAQKHLADISSKLEEIQKGVAGISRFLDNQRKARISSTYEYLGQVYTALQGGELPEAARHELESCERDLIEIQQHLMAEYRQKAHTKVEVGTWGTKKTCRGIETKLNELDLLAQDIAVCLETRIAAWCVLSLFPGNPHQKMARRDNIQESIRSFVSLGSCGQDNVQAEITSINSVWNRTKTLESRRRSLEGKNTAAVQNLSDLSTRALGQIWRSEQVMLEADRPTHLLLHIENGVVVGAEQRA